MSQRLKVMLAVLTSVLLAENSLESQQTDTPAIEKPAATFTARTELVTVPVVVRGKGGKHLTGLKQADFVIEENGHRREIATFEEITTSSSPFRQPANAANQFTNFLRSEPQARRATIIVLDLLNTPFLRQWETKRQIIHFLSAHLEDTGPTSLCVLTSRGLRQVHSFTTDTSILIEALKKTETSFSAADRTSENPFVDPESHNPLDGFSTIASPTSEADILHEILAERADVMFGAYVQKQQTLTTLEALEEIGQSAKGIPGRKSLIWATAGLPFLLNDPDNILGIDSSLMNNYERTWQVLNNASVSVYPIDAQGLLAPELSKRSAIPGWSGPGQSSASSMRGSRMRGPARPPVDAH